jgi:glycine dehydrogenase subunit 1
LSLAYILNTSDDQKEMLATICAKSMDELFASIPTELRLKRPLNIPPAMSELELTQHMQALSRRNQSSGEVVCFLGGGSYDHFIPTVVDAVAGRGEFYTAYTPYQAEASQGSLQAFFEYQTLICQLTGMEIANASMYEAGSGVAEAVIMATNVTGRKGQVLVAESMHPEYRQVLATYLANLHLEVVTLPTPDGYLDPARVKRAVTDQTICVVAQHPNFFGGLEEVEALAEIAHTKGALFVVSFDPISLGLLKRPGQFGADIAVAEGQSLGTPMAYGGPYLGILACRKEYVRNMPGRLVGETVDRNGKRCWVLTFTTREQHVRREKATSNICTNQGLLALRATAYLTALGPQGMKETAELCLRKAHYAANELGKIPGVELCFRRPFFKEFAVRTQVDSSILLSNLRRQGFNAGLPLTRWFPDQKNSFIMAVTEKRTRAEIDGLARAMRQALTNR